MTRFAVYTRKKRIIPNRRSSDGTLSRRSSFYQKNGPVFQVKTWESKAENRHFFQNEAMKRYQAKTT